MNFYEAVVKFMKLNTEEENDSRALFAPADEKNPKSFIRVAFEGINKSLGVRCDAKEAYSIFFWEAEKGKASIIFSVDMDKANMDSAISYIKDYLEKNYDVCSVQISDIKEITTGRFHQLGTRGDNNGLIRRFMADENDMGLDYRENNQYQIREEMIPTEKLLFIV